MTIFDFVVIVVIALSTIVAMFRGLIREVVAIASWVAALVLGFLYAETVAGVFTGLNLSPVLAEVIGFVVVFVVVLIVGGLVARLLSHAIKMIGLGWLDGVLGAGFGVLRGVALVLLGVLVAGLTDLPRRDWWQNALLAPPFVAAALEFRDWLPPGWAARLNFSPTGAAPPGAGVRI